MRIIKQCPKCGCRKIATSTGKEVWTEFVNGKLDNKNIMPFPRQVWCTKCYENVTDYIREMKEGKA